MADCQGTVMCIHQHHGCQLALDALIWLFHYGNNPLPGNLMHNYSLIGGLLPSRQSKGGVKSCLHSLFNDIFHVGDTCNYTDFIQSFIEKIIASLPIKITDTSGSD